MPGKILIVDDEDLVVRSLEKLLRKAGYEVISARTAEQGMERLKQFDFDLIVSDIRMPGMGGVEMVRKMRSLLDESKRGRIPEIFISGFASDEMTKEVEGLKPSEYVYKPFDMRIFLGLVEKHIKKSNQPC